MDQYTVGQAGTVGPNGHSEGNTFNQIWNQALSTIDLAKLSQELKELRMALKAEATEPTHDSAVGEVAAAEVAAKNGDGPKALEHLRSAGKWALEKATEIGVPVATAALIKVIGVG